MYKIMHQLTHISWFSMLSECFRIYSAGQISCNMSRFALSLQFQRTSVNMEAGF